MKIDVLDTTGKKASQVTLSDEVFGETPNMSLIAQYLRVFRLNQMQGTSSTKTRAEVRGGGKKPWRQKGTGRARHGSRRSPIWRHGGITHGPKPKVWHLDFPKKMKRAAFVSTLSLKMNKSQIKVLDGFELKAPKTSEVAKLIKDLNLKGKVLFVLPENNKVLVKSVGNMKNVKVSNVDILNVFELLNCNQAVFLKDAIKKVEGKYENK